MLRNLFKSVFGKSPREDLKGLDAMARGMRRVVPKCLICGKASAGRRFAQIASIPWNKTTDARVEKLLECIENHEWDALKHFDGMAICRNQRILSGEIQHIRSLVPDDVWFGM